MDLHFVTSVAGYNDTDFSCYDVCGVDYSNYISVDKQFGEQSETSPDWTRIE